MLDLFTRIQNGLFSLDLFIGLYWVERLYSAVSLKAFYLLNAVSPA